MSNPTIQALVNNVISGGAPQGLVLGPLLHLLYINYIQIQNKKKKITTSYKREGKKCFTHKKVRVKYKQYHKISYQNK